MQHEIDLGIWFITNERQNDVLLTSGYGPGMLISVHKDSPNFATIEFCTLNGSNDCCTYFNLNNLYWYQDEVYRNERFAPAEIRHSVDKLSDFQCYNSYTTVTSRSFN